MVWTLVEPGVAIVASSLVTIRPLLRKMRLKGFESTERSRGLRFGGQSGSGGMGYRGGGNQSVTRRTIGSMPGYGPDNVKLADLEPGSGGNKGYWSQGTTLTSRTSTHAGSRPGGWGVGVAVTVQEDDEDADRISPIGVAIGDGVPHRGHFGHGHRRSGGSTPDSDVFVIEGPSRPHPAAQTTQWRSDTPTSPEESEHSQGLRHAGYHGGLTGPRRVSSPDFPIQNTR